MNLADRQSSFAAIVRHAAAVVSQVDLLAWRMEEKPAAFRGLIVGRARVVALESLRLLEAAIYGVESIEARNVAPDATPTAESLIEAARDAVHRTIGRVATVSPAAADELRVTWTQLVDALALLGAHPFAHVPADEPAPAASASPSASTEPAPAPAKRAPDVQHAIACAQRVEWRAGQLLALAVAVASPTRTRSLDKLADELREASAALRAAHDDIIAALVPDVDDAGRREYPMVPSPERAPNPAPADDVDEPEQGGGS